MSLELHPWNVKDKTWLTNNPFYTTCIKVFYLFFVIALMACFYGASSLGTRAAWRLSTSGIGSPYGFLWSWPPCSKIKSSF